MLNTLKILTLLLLIELPLKVLAQETTKTSQLIAAARSQIGVTVRYDPSYLRLKFPGGDPPIDRGVCTDVLIRAMRKVGVDLQVLVHQDMKRNFSKYPKIWGLKQPDTNIDHRRVPNLMVFLEHSGKKVGKANSYQAGDIVTWRLDNGLPHIGILSDRKSGTSGHPLAIHNIGAGTQEEDILYKYQITGHYRYFSS